MALPQEAFGLVFSHLEANDLLQCQLTSKQWHKASSKPLYSSILLDRIEKLFKYVRTIKSLPQLGKYLNTIDFRAILYYMPKWGEFNKIRLLDSVIKLCPNITEMYGTVGNDRFWLHLIHAATRGKLSRLETLPNPGDALMEPYNTATLAFKNTLTSFFINCDHLYSQRHNQINEFKNLKTLFFKSNYLKSLSYFGELINKYPSVTRININASNDDDYSNLFPRPTKYGPTILSRPDMQALECPWDLICDQSQQEYLMHKFPNLQRLKVWSWYNDSFVVCDPGLSEFIRYALSLPDFELEILVNIEIIGDVWNEFIMMKNGCKNVTFSYLEDHHVSYEVGLNRKLGFHLKFSLSTLDNIIPHIYFLSEAGRSIQSLRIDYMEPFLFKDDETITTIDWLFDILLLCPLLEELTIEDPAPLSPIHHELRHLSLKKLTIDQLENIQSIEFLNCLSLNLPNLCQLSLIFNDNYMGPVIIDMPHTSFDLLLSNGGPAFREPEVYIKLNTEKGLEYYLGERSMLVPINESRYLLSPQSVRFDISCKHLKELRIRRALPELDFKFIF